MKCVRIHEHTKDGMSVFLHMVLAAISFVSPLFMRKHPFSQSAGWIYIDLIVSEMQFLKANIEKVCVMGCVSYYTSDTQS